MMKFSTSFILFALATLSRAEGNSSCNANPCKEKFENRTNSTPVCRSFNAYGVCLKLACEGALTAEYKGLKENNNTFKTCKTSVEKAKEKKGKASNAVKKCISDKGGEGKDVVKLCTKELVKNNQDAVRDFAQAKQEIAKFLYEKFKNCTGETGKTEETCQKQLKDSGLPVGQLKKTLKNGVGAAMKSRFEECKQKGSADCKQKAKDELKERLPKNAKSTTIENEFKTAMLEDSMSAFSECLAAGGAKKECRDELKSSIPEDVDVKELHFFKLRAALTAAVESYLETDGSVTVKKEAAKDAWIARDMSVDQWNRDGRIKKRFNLRIASPDAEINFITKDSITITLNLVGADLSTINSKVETIKTKVKTAVSLTDCKLNETNYDVGEIFTNSESHDFTIRVNCTGDCCGKLVNAAREKAGPAAREAFTSRRRNLLAETTVTTSAEQDVEGEIVADDHDDHDGHDHDHEFSGAPGMMATLTLVLLGLQLFL